MFSLALSLLRDVEGLLPFWAKGEELKDEAAAAVAFLTLPPNLLSVEKKTITEVANYGDVLWACSVCGIVR
jgi:hypothetical protein